MSDGHRAGELFYHLIGDRAAQLYLYNGARWRLGVLCIRSATILRLC